MRPFLLLIFFVSALFATIHLVALNYALYWLLPWLDIPMHFAGGFVVALIAVWFFRYVRKDVSSEAMSGEHILMFALSVALLVGIAWEAFEYITNIRDTANYVLDTATDLVMDLIGANAAYWVLVHSRLKSVIQ